MNPKRGACERGGIQICMLGVHAFAGHKQSDPREKWNCSNFEGMEGYWNRGSWGGQRRRLRCRKRSRGQWAARRRHGRTACG